MDFPQICSTSRGEVPSQTQRASETAHLLRFHVNVYFGRCVRLMFPPVKHLEKRLKRTVCFFPHPPFEKTESIDGSKTNRSHMIAYLLSPADFFIFFSCFGWGCVACLGDTCFLPSHHKLSLFLIARRFTGPSHTSSATSGCSTAGRL